MSQEILTSNAPSMLTPFQATYHWRNKNCYPWASTWFKSELPGLRISSSSSPLSAEITEVTTVEGDVDLGQRKGKVLTIYDVKIVANWKGTDSEGKEVEGTLTLPEVSHECIDGLSDYTYEWSSTPDSALNTFLRTQFPSVLEAKLNAFPAALVAANNPDSSAAASGTATPASAPSASAGRYSPLPPGEVRQPSPASTSTSKPKAASINTGSIRTEARLAASADDLWALLTDETKIPMWARSPAKFSTTAGAPYELFGGNVHGKIESAEKGKKLVQSWQLRSPSWPVEHFGTMTITLDQGSSDTNVIFTLSGIPKGQEDTIRNAIETYYIRSLKQMGLVVSSFDSKVTTESKPTEKKPEVTKTKSKARSNKKAKAASNARAAPGAWTDVAGYAVVGALVAGLAGIVWSSYPTRP